MWRTGGGREGGGREGMERKRGKQWYRFKVHQTPRRQTGEVISPFWVAKKIVVLW